MKINLDWNKNELVPRGSTQLITTLETHAGGEPLRIVTGGLPSLPGATMLERRRYLQENFDQLRQALLWEPRGHSDMYGAVITPPVTPEADLGVLFMHNEGYSTMCGHGVIALVTALLETGAIEPQGDKTRVTLDTPAGVIQATAFWEAAQQRVSRVSFLNVPSFLYQRDISIKGRRFSQFNKIKIDVAFGGAFYAIVPIDRLGFDSLADVPLAQLVKLGASIKSAYNNEYQIEHPVATDLGFLYGTIIVGPPKDTAHHSANLCIFADRAVDRSPTGTGVAARLATHHFKGEMAPGSTLAIESIIGSVFEGRLAGKTKVGKFEAIIPEISGQAFVTGRSQFIIDSTDQFGAGFLLK